MGYNNRDKDTYKAYLIYLHRANTRQDYTFAILLGLIALIPITLAFVLL